jgi:hypothetical protein
MFPVPPSAATPTPATAPIGGGPPSLPGFSAGGGIPAIGAGSSDGSDFFSNSDDGYDDFAPVDDHLAKTSRTDNTRTIDDHLARTSRTANTGGRFAQYEDAYGGSGSTAGWSGIGKGGLGGGALSGGASGGGRSQTAAPAAFAAANNNINESSAHDRGTHPGYHSDSSGDDDYVQTQTRSDDGEGGYEDDGDDDGPAKPRVSQVEQMELLEEELVVEHDDDDDEVASHRSGEFIVRSRPPSRAGSARSSASSVASHQSSASRASRAGSVLSGIFGRGQGGQQQQQADHDRDRDRGPPVTMTGRASLLSGLAARMGGGSSRSNRSSNLSRSSSINSFDSRASQNQHQPNRGESHQSSLNSLNYGPVVFEAPLNDTEEYGMYMEEPHAYSRGRQRIVGPPAAQADANTSNRRSYPNRGGSLGSGGSDDDYYGSGSGDSNDGGDSTGGHDEYDIDAYRHDGVVEGFVHAAAAADAPADSGEDYLQAAADATHSLVEETRTRQRRRSRLSGLGGLKRMDSLGGSSFGSDGPGTDAAAQDQQQVPQQQQGGGGSVLDRHLVAGEAAAAADLQHMDSRSSADNRSTNSAGLYTYGYSTDGTSGYGEGSQRSLRDDGEEEDDGSGDSPDLEEEEEEEEEVAADRDVADGTPLSKRTGQTSARSFGSNPPVTQVKQ